MQATRALTLCEGPVAAVGVGVADVKTFRSGQAGVNFSEPLACSSSRLRDGPIYFRLSSSPLNNCEEHRRDSLMGCAKTFRRSESRKDSRTMEIGRGNSRRSYGG